MRSQSVAKSLGPGKRGWNIYAKRWISGWSLGCWDFILRMIMGPEIPMKVVYDGNGFWNEGEGILPESPFRCVKYLKWNVKSPVRLSWLMFGWGHYELAGKNLYKFTSNLFQLFWRWAHFCLINLCFRGYPQAWEQLNELVRLVWTTEVTKFDMLNPSTTPLPLRRYC